MAVVLTGYTATDTSVDGFRATSLAADQPSVAVPIGIAALMKCKEATTTKSKSMRGKAIFIYCAGKNWGKCLFDPLLMPSRYNSKKQ